jgi:3',5'-cyclic AMP phosphodiesterase CpdA
MRIAHLSDLHLLNLEGAVPSRLFNKRFTGYVNIRLKRGSVHKAEVARAVARAVHDGNFDHVVVTGDVTNLSLEGEFESVREYLERDVALGSDAISVVPGNHDAYTRGAYESGRFEQYLGDYMTSDLPDGDALPDHAAFPFVRLRGPLALIGLSSAVPRPPLVASGVLGRRQRLALAALLAHDEVRRRTPVILQHHPWHSPKRTAKRLLEGLLDAKQQAEAFAAVEHGMLLHGHLHRRQRRTLDTASGQLHAVCATSASLLHDDEHRMAGFNAYQFGDDGSLESVSAMRYQPGSEAFVATDVPVVEPGW